MAEWRRASSFSIPQERVKVLGGDVGGGESEGALVGMDGEQD